MTEWECEDCGLVHCHAKHLHTMWNNMDWEYCKKLQFNPDCNCGAREAHERGFIDLPHPPAVPEPTMGEIEELA